ncbi:MAG: FG-GAP repeat protein [Rhodanobacteraceae bacterium]|nr:FG-GAP repeat protein [Rhodanobacteraceae bacterium]
MASPNAAATAAFSLGGLDGTTGVRLDGATDDQSGISVSTAGDVNGDGVDDLIVGADMANGQAGDRTGAAYVVYGKRPPYSATFALHTLDGTNGFRLEGGASGDQIGRSVAAAGDFNADGIDDLVVGTTRGTSASGRIFVVFGRSTAFPATISVASLDGSNGVVLDCGPVLSGSAVAVVDGAGDVNGDGVDDIVIGASGASSAAPGSGLAIVVFGRRSPFPPTLSMAALDGTDGFRLSGVQAEMIGTSASGAGDINADGFDDIAIGAAQRYVSGVGPSTGSAYVVFGKSTPYAATTLTSSLDGHSGFRIDGESAFSVLGKKVSGAGDINGDGFDDLVIGAPGFNDGAQQAAGAAYVITGRSAEFSAQMNVSGLDGANGLQLRSTASNGFLASSVSSAGDVNDDGFDDLLIGSHLANPNGQPHAGSSYVVFGKGTAFDADMDLEQLGTPGGLRLDGTAANEVSGSSIGAAGDVNADGIGDLIVGAPGAGPGGTFAPRGSSYVVFGQSDRLMRDGFERR